MRIGTILLLGLLSTAGVVDAQDYILHIIPPFGPGSLNEAYAYDVNSAGQVVGQSIGGTTAGFVWSPGTGVVQVTFGGVAVAEDGTYASSGGIYDSAGALVGSIPAVDTFFTAIRPGAIRTGLVFPDGTTLDGPVVVGRSFDPTIDPGPGSCFDCIAPAANSAFIYDPVNGSRNLDALGVPESFFARDLNAAGLIVGNTNDTGQDFNTRAFVFDLFTGTGVVDLGTLRPDDAGVASAEGVNDAGQVCGFATSPSAGDEHAFLWTEASGMVDLGTLGASSSGIIDRSRAFDINSGGAVVGMSTSPDTVSPIAIRHPFIWDAANGMRDLNTLVDLPPSYELVSATAISDTGWICGYGVGSAGMGFTSGWVLEPIVPTGGSAPFVRGDCNVDGTIDVADAIASLAFLFVSGTPQCQEACDANDDGGVDIADAITQLASLFTGTGPLPAPGPGCGPDTTTSSLTCDDYGACP